jgi:hypothetical protein
MPCSYKSWYGGGDALRRAPTNYRGRVLGRAIAARPFSSTETVDLELSLEVEAEFGGVGSRCHEVRAAEGGQEVVERGLVGQIDDREAQAPLVMVGMEQIVVAYAGVEQIAGFDACGIVVQIKRGACNVEQRCSRPSGIRAADGPGAQGKGRG